MPRPANQGPKSRGELMNFARDRMRQTPIFISVHAPHPPMAHIQQPWEFACLTMEQEF